MPDPSLLRFRVVVEGALAHLESRRQEINDLNVFPVADGDTGDNMALTLRAVLAEVDRLASQGRALDDFGREEIVDSVARAALLGARGNSGVILSQLIRGAAEELISRPGELVDPVLISAAMARAAQRAYDSVREPAEGTMLTVMREMATAVATELAHLPAERTRLEAADGAERQNALIAAVLERAIVAGEASVKRGPQLLPALREAGVVDAGGYAVTIIFAGVVAALRNAEAPVLEHHAPAPARVTHPEHTSATFRYCTNFAVTGAQLSAEAFIGALEELGDSVLVVGDSHTLKVHVHTDDPERARALFTEHGVVSQLDVADMRDQVAGRDERLRAGGVGRTEPQQRCGALAVATGEGLKALFEEYGATVLDGGATLNPSTMELLAGIHDVPAEEVVLLPNSANVRMAAERAAELSDKAVRVVPSTSQQAGLLAVVALDMQRPLEENAERMAASLESVRTGGVAGASREDPEGRFAVGDAVGYVDEALVAWGDPSTTLGAVLERLAEGCELITAISGDGAPLDHEAVRALVPDGVELEAQDGGQPAWWWLLAAE